MCERRVVLGVLTVVLCTCAGAFAQKAAPKGKEAGAAKPAGRVELKPLKKGAAGDMRVSYPHGSPFPPGGEPSRTHTATVYWTTLNGMQTKIRVTAKGGS